MAYVRKKGNQVMIVHGLRDADGGKVQQQTLFVFYSKAEALAAMGDSGLWLRQFLQDEYPSIRFDWEKLNAGIKEQMVSLPDLYSYKKDRVEGRFRTAVVDIARELLVADPQMIISSARLLQDQRHELEYVRDLIDWRLKCADQEETKWSKDDPFYWRTLTSRREVPIDGMETLSTLYQEAKYEQAEALAKLLVECWPNYAEGYNYLGFISMDRDDLNTAREQFDKAMEVGRKAFPKRIKKDGYWSDHSTRPYIRAMISLAQAHNRMGEYSTALKLCDRLEQECNQGITAASERIAIFLNTGSWESAAKAARHVHKIYAEENLTLAFALCEMREERKSLVHFLNGAIRFPRTARMLCGMRITTSPKSSTEEEAHNLGVGYLRDLEAYFEDQNNNARDFFKSILQKPNVKTLIKKAENVRQKWRENRSTDRTWFDLMNEMESVEFAETKVAEFWRGTYV